MVEARVQALRAELEARQIAGRSLIEAMEAGDLEACKIGSEIFIAMFSTTPGSNSAALN